MAPFALLFGLLIATAPPLALGALELQRASARARVHAEELATQIRDDALRDAYIWRWRLPKITQHLLTAPPIADDLAAVEIHGCDGQLLHRAVGSQETVSLTLREPIPVVVHSQRIATIRVAYTLDEVGGPLGLLAACSALLGLLSALALYGFPTRVVSTQAAALEHHMDELERTNAELHQRVQHGVNAVRALSAQLTMAQDAERERIARDLHDGVAQQLWALHMTLAGQDAPPELLEQCEAILEDLRATIHDLHPIALQGEALPDVLGAMAERFEIRCALATYTRVDPFDGPPLSRTVATAVLRITQEALHNIERHAQASEVQITLRRDATSIMLQIRDDGEGMPPGARERGHGLANMRTRAELLGGTFSIEHDAGVVITVEIPRT